MTAAYWIVRLKRWCGIDLIGLLDRQLIYIPCSMRRICVGEFAPCGEILRSGIGLLDRQLIYIPTQPSFALFTLMPGPMVEAMTQLLIY